MSSGPIKINWKLVPNQLKFNLYLKKIPLPRWPLGLEDELDNLGVTVTQLHNRHGMRYAYKKLKVKKFDFSKLINPFN